MSDPFAPYVPFAGSSSFNEEALIRAFWRGIRLRRLLQYGQETGPEHHAAKTFDNFFSATLAAGNFVRINVARSQSEVDQRLTAPRQGNSGTSGEINWSHWQRMLEELSGQAGLRPFPRYSWLLDADGLEDFSALTDWTRKRPREIRRITDDGENGQLARLSRSASVYRRNGGAWVLAPGERPDLIEELGRARRGDYFGPWIPQEIHDALKRMQRVRLRSYNTIDRSKRYFGYAIMPWQPINGSDASFFAAQNDAWMSISAGVTSASQADQGLIDAQAGADENEGGFGNTQYLHDSNGQRVQRRAAPIAVNEPYRTVDYTRDVPAGLDFRVTTKIRRIREGVDAQGNYSRTESTVPGPTLGPGADAVPSPSYSKVPGGKLIKDTIEEQFWEIDFDHV